MTLPTHPRPGAQGVAAAIAIHREHVHPPAAWRGERLEKTTDWITSFAPAQLSEIDAALRAAQRAGRTADDIDRAAFPLPTVGPFLEAQLPILQQGRGFMVLRGLPVADYSDEDVGLIFRGLGAYLGEAVAQNPRGDLLGHVFDQGRKFGTVDVRGYETNAHLPFHGDGCDLVGLLCLRKARAGGFSSLASGLEMHNEVLLRRPDLLPVLYRGFHYIKREAAHTDAPVTARPLPVFGVVDGVLSCYFNPPKIEAAYEVLKTPMSPQEREAFALMVSLTQDPALHLDMDLEVGDIQFCNNYSVLHSRTEYTDWPEPTRKRHMLRLWLTFESRRPLAAGFPSLDGYRRHQLARLSDL